MNTENAGALTLPEALDAEFARHLLQDMLRIRRMEEKSAECYSNGQIRGFLHLYVGEEAVATGVLNAINSDDDVVATYREHAHALLHGITMREIFAEMFGKQEGCCRGRGGSMHLFSQRARFYGGNAIVGGGLPLAVGLALANQMLQPDQQKCRVTICFFGEGAMAEGAFHESANLAALWQLPLLFVCENNLYAMGTALSRSEAQPDLCTKAESYRLATQCVDGMDVLAVHAAASRALQAIHHGNGPQFLECRTYRFRAHSMFDPQLYRDQTEVERWKQRGPIHTFSAALKAKGLLDENGFLALDQKAQLEVNDAIEFAEAGQFEPTDSLYADVGADKRIKLAAEHAALNGSRTMSYREALHDSVHEALQRDDRVVLIGEDIGRYGGAQAVTRGLLQAFGERRVRDAPLSELAFVGAGIGAALGGLKPIVEIMTVNFSLLALDAIINTAATLRHMSGGQFTVPLVLRMTTGAGRQLAAQHSHSFEGWFAHIPGLKIYAPYSVADARQMLATALQQSDPVLIFEHAQLYNREGPVDLAYAFDETAVVRRAGDTLSLISYGAGVELCLQAAEQLAAEDIAAEVVDLRVLRPLDEATIMASLRKTHRVLIVDEGWRSGSLSAEIMARINEQAFFELDAAPQRICSEEVPIPYAKHLEAAALPSVNKILAAARRIAHNEDGA